MDKIPYIPATVAEWIDNHVLPNWADGYNSPEDIYEMALDECRFCLENTEYSGNGEQHLIDCWVVYEGNKKMFVDYVEYVFSAWESETGD